MFMDWTWIMTVEDVKLMHLYLENITLYSPGPVNQTIEPAPPVECPEEQTPLECLGELVGPPPECAEEPNIVGMSWKNS